MSLTWRPREVKQTRPQKSGNSAESLQETAFRWGCAYCFSLWDHILTRNPIETHVVPRSSHASENPGDLAGVKDGGCPRSKQAIGNQILMVGTVLGGLSRRHQLGRIAADLHYHLPRTPAPPAGSAGADCCGSGLRRPSEVIPLGRLGPLGPCFRVYGRGRC